MRRFFRFFLIPLLLAFCSDALSAEKTRQYRAVVVREYPHDVTSYTQGLFFEDGQMYESTGGNGSSTFRKVELSSGRALRRLDFGKKYFVEGSVVLGNDLYILTWTNRVAFRYSYPELGYEATYSYGRQGWGLTTDGEHLIASDGSSKLYFMTPDLKTVSEIQVMLHGRPLNLLNELEYIDGKIWANVYTSDMIVIIEPSDGTVEAVIDCSGLLPDRLRTADTDVLNGIAYDSVTGRIYVTGKNWPRLYEIRIEEK